MMTSETPIVHKDLQLQSYQYDLPEELIASRPASERDNSRLLNFDQLTGEHSHETFSSLANLLPENSLLVFNQSKVFPCRMIGEKYSGGKCEVFVLNVVADDNDTYRCLIRARGKKLVRDRFYFDDGVEVRIEAINNDGTFQISLNDDSMLEVLQSIGQIPIPPYIRGGKSDEQDLEDYQTLYAKEVGSVAAPTAGLHFTDQVFESLKNKNIDTAYVTLHVGMGTFAPVKSDVITDHSMHREEFYVDAQNLRKLNEAKAEGKQIYCVGTTSLRVLESIYSNGKFNIQPGGISSTDIFLHPGKKIESIDGIVTNFHLPGSSLLMLVSTLIGREKTMDLYKEAIANKYRFFSYGDAMLIRRKSE